MAVLTGTSAGDTLEGGAGADTFDGGAGLDLLIGNGGNDLFNSSTGADDMRGGEGDDTFAMVHAAVILGGPGRDMYRFGTPQESWASIPVRYDLGAPTIIGDFTVGAGGDVIDLTPLFTSIVRVWFGTYDTIAIDPFSSGQARLVDAATGVRLETLDYEGWKPMVVLTGVTASQLTSDNFSAGTSVRHVLDPVSGASTSETTSVVIDPRNQQTGKAIDGFDAGESIAGTSFNDTVRGFDGNDTIDGGAGNDDVNGNRGDDIVYGGSGDDTVRGGQGADTVYGGVGDDRHVNGNLSDDMVWAGAGNDTVYGGQGNDTVAGESGNDLISGDLGNDLVYGGLGGDWFVFKTGGGHDRITDFNFGEGDRIVAAPGSTVTWTAVANPSFFQGYGVIFQLGSGDTFTIEGSGSVGAGADWVVYVAGY